MKRKWIESGAFYTVTIFLCESYKISRKKISMKKHGKWLLAVLDEFKVSLDEWNSIITFQPTHNSECVILNSESPAIPIPTSLPELCVYVKHNSAIDLLSSRFSETMERIEHEWARPHAHKLIYLLIEECETMNLYDLLFELGNVTLELFIKEKTNISTICHVSSTLSRKHVYVSQNNLLVKCIRLVVQILTDFESVVFNEDPELKSFRRWFQCDNILQIMEKENISMPPSFSYDAVTYCL